MKIDEDVLCAFCRGHYDESLNWHCEGTHCGEIREIFLKENGISCDDAQPKVFRKLCVDDKIFVLKTGVIPSIDTEVVNSINKMNGGSMHVNYQSTGIEIKDEAATSQGSIFLNKKDCKEALEELCLNRILELSKIIGGISK